MSARMADIGPKNPVLREAAAEGIIRLRAATLDRIKGGGLDKGDALAVARIAAFLAVKRTADNIPLCHPIPVDHVTVDFEFRDGAVAARVAVRATAKTGVEMEALSGVTAALLTLWDMTKQYEKDDLGQYPDTSIESIRVLEKRKGSGRITV